MLVRILEILRQQEICSIQEIAEKLNTTVPFILARLELLEKQGHIKKVCSLRECGKKCVGCTPPAATPMMWELSE